MDWKDQNVNSLICYCKKVTKKDVILAINNGARTLDDIRETTEACTGDQCRVLNPTGRSCGSDLQAMIEYYAPLAEAFRKS